MVTNMTKGNPIKLILAFSVPLLIGNIFQQFYNITDMIIVGRFIGVNALAAVGGTAPLFMALLGITVGLSSGFSVITGQRFGAGDMEGVRKSFVMSVLLSIVLTFFITITMILALPSCMDAIHIPAELYDDSYGYVLVITYGLWAMMGYALLSCMSRALGDSRTPLYFLILSTLVNVALALIFIVSFGWGVRGSAIALVLSQALSGFLCLIYMQRRFPMLRPQRSDWHWNHSFAWKHLRIGIPMALQFMLISLGIIAVQSVCNTFGPEVIAGFVSASRIEQLAMQPMISFGIAMSVYTAQNVGARKFDRIRKGVRQCSLLSLGFCAFAAIAMFVGGKNMIGIFTTTPNESLLDAAWLYLTMSVPFYFFLGQIFVYRNAVQGMGISIVPFLSSLIELILRIMAAFLLATQFVFFGLCMASPICWIAACLFTSGCYFYVMKKTPI